MAEFLLELLSEEIPANMQEGAVDWLQRAIWEGLVDARLLEKDLPRELIRRFATPRRIAVSCPNVVEHQENFQVERKGPRVGAPEAALTGFKRSLGDLDYRLEERSDKKGAFYVAIVQEAGRPATEIIGPVVEEALQNFLWPKSMRWGNHNERWVRPLGRILCLLDDEVVPLKYGPITSGRMTEGHRFMCGEPFELRHARDYANELEARKVLLIFDQEDKKDIADDPIGEEEPKGRRARIMYQASYIANSLGLDYDHKPKLIEEIAGLVEWPKALKGRIDPTFMELPSEVLVTSMRQHQKYIALYDKSGQLAPYFIVVANIEAKDGGKALIAGNERVLRARLWDAKFFWDQDNRRPLDELVPKLDDIVFHAKLGSVGAKVQRIEVLAGWLADRMEGADVSAAKRAAQLAKADLVSGMVGEFPELQGLMGSYYARGHGEPGVVAEAIGDHYAPQGPNDACPTAPVSIAVALADKLDTLAGFFAIGEKPTGSKDPFALRRAALGVIRLVLENKLRLPLRDVFAQTRMGYRDLDIDDLRESMDDLQSFFADRLKVHLRQSGVRHDLISAVFATGDDDLVRLLARVDALEKFLASDDGANLLAGYRRANNIVRIETKKDGLALDGNVDDTVLAAAEECRLYDGLLSADHRIGRALENEDFTDAMSALADLRRPIDTFFDKVIVNADDPNVRKNRLNLLSNIHRSIVKVANLSLIEDVTTENHNRRVA